MNDSESTGKPDQFLDKILGMDSPPLPAPKPPSKCPLFCCFYAEFDIKVGPMICFQSPIDFMDQDINVPTSKIHDILESMFENFQNCERENKIETEEGSTSLKLGEGVDEFSPCPDSGLSIFDATSEYIITGNELTGKIVTLSTHDMHIMTRPTLISDARYERNALLFSVGIVLRRAADPRPFRPLISKLALTLRSMEIESQFLSNPSLRNKHLQPLLERVLVCLNSSQWECNLLLSRSNALNLKLFHPPKPEASLVHDHQVPILLRKDIQLQMYDWDLAINWVILHIDGVTNARQISIKAEVDLEMVRACLRVLKHHGVIDLVDMFLYSNRYEFTEKATSMLAGKESRILQEAVDFVLKRQASEQIITASPAFGSGGGQGSDSSLNQVPNSPIYTPSSSYPPRTMNLLGCSHKGSNLKIAMMAAQSLDREPSIGARREDQRIYKAALAELYCACNRNISFGDLWLSLTTELPPSQGMKCQPPFVNANTPTRKTSIADEYSDVDHIRDHLDSLGFSPLETLQIDAMRKSNRDEITIDWNEFFLRFDHRRFCSFGQVHGLLRRVHNYPFFPGSFPEQDPPSSNSVDGSNSRHSLKDEFVEEKLYLLAKNIAMKMDGTRCDDELVSLYEKPFSRLVALVEKLGKKKILSIYATGSGS